jgi:conjugative relaxase-like TrwC/TraI family protein
VLNLATVRDPRLDYYLADLGDELRQVAPWLAPGAGRWLGTGTVDFGLHGLPDPEVLKSVLEGRHPRTGRPLLSKDRSVVAFDLTFSTSKSVSVLFGLGGPRATQTVAEAHRAGVEAAVGYVERRATASRRSGPEGRALVSCDGVVASAFTHCLSRSGDPHLHTHVVVANLAHGLDGRWSALDSRSLFAHAKAAGSVHDAHLRAVLSARLGVQWSWCGRSGWELKNSDPAVLAALSSRSSEIRQEQWEHGGRSKRARHVAWAATRSAKGAGPQGVALRSLWLGRAGQPTFELGAKPAAVGQGTLDEDRFAAAIAAAPPSGVCRRDVVAAWAVAAGQGVEGLELQRAVDEWAPATANALGVAEPRTAPARYVMKKAVLRELGPRPAGVAGQAAWRAAAAAIERYLTRWGNGFDAVALRPGQSLAALPPARLADHLEVSRLIREVRVLVGSRQTPVLERDVHWRG